LIVIPAHDEESGVATTVQSCLAANYPSLLFGVVVIADNCSDQTAREAALAGARVMERFDSAKKSKGYALEFLIESLSRSGELDAHAALVIVDADTTIDRDLLRYFDQALRAGRDWIQCYYTVANPDQSWRTRLLTYAFSLFNGVMLAGQCALGSSAGFKGNGMCFSTRGLRRRPWQCYGLVEDMEYSWTLRTAGEKIAFLREACVYGDMVGSGGTAAANQRRRWEFGRSEIRKKYLGRLFTSREIGWWDKAVSICELTIPSMAYLAIIYVAAAALDVIAFFALATEASVLVRGILLAGALIITVSLGVYALSPFLVMRLPWRFARSIAFFPSYLGWKLLISVSGRPKEWVRTVREPRGKELVTRAEEATATGKGGP
jgi:cellulose synthase/poly-beta-1,6-N-acetylglucosamine synthase-like glycosyltransferase